RLTLSCGLASSRYGKTPMAGAAKEISRYVRRRRDVEVRQRWRAHSVLSSPHATVMAKYTPNTQKYGPAANCGANGKYTSSRTIRSDCTASQKNTRPTT